ncbi:MAG: hypothetical protein HRU18_03510 [Pseudoalteromonas sp.]|uniref:hypothetical protein n=1 Tax=Pseudoalteromonas sp. TaxID=53249 RepID=UPI001E1456B6|nr:hypothetical protein [Pseudoalteromonas sp.]NRA77253.1 hypothetical protein [Pseudoalteromonas sp.]
MGKSTEYYRKNAKARRKKAATDKKINARPSQVKKRVEANRARRKAKAAGKNVKGKDYDHAVKRFVKSSTNRGRKGEGGRKKK